MSTLGGVYHSLIPLITLISQCLFEQAKLQRAAVWNISLGSHGKISIDNWIWRIAWFGIVFYWGTVWKQRTCHTKVTWRSNWQKSLKYISLLTYKPVDLLKFSIYFQNMYQIYNKILVIVTTHSHYSPNILYENIHHWNDLNLTLEAQFQEAEGRPLCMSTVAILYID